jgi:hypothetical protein
VMFSVSELGIYVLPRSLDYAARRDKLRRGGKCRTAPLGMTEKRKRGPTLCKLRSCEETF